jgi:hypothetical protein
LVKDRFLHSAEGVEVGVRGSSKGERNGRRKQSLAWEGRRTEDARSEEFFD